MKKGREQFELAINIIANRRDEHSLFLKGFTYDVWGGMEYSNNQIKEGKQAFDLAQSTYEGLPAGNRQLNLNSLAVHKMTAFRATSAAADVVKDLLGTWRSQDAVPLQVTITDGKDGMLQASLHFPDGPLPSNGTITLEDDTVADLVWPSTSTWMGPAAFNFRPNCDSISEEEL